MFDPRVSLQDNLVALLSAPQAEVDIVVVHGKRFVEAAQFVEHAAPHHEARGRYGRLFACHSEPGPNWAAIGEASRVSGAVRRSEIDASVLDAAVWISEQRAYSTHVRAFGLGGHQAHPIAIQRDGVVIEKQKQPARRGSHSGVAHSCEVEVVGIGNSYRAKSPGERLHGGAVIDENYFIPVVGGSGANRVEALGGKYRISGADHDRNQVRGAP